MENPTFFKILALYTERPRTRCPDTVFHIVLTKGVEKSP